MHLSHDVLYADHHYYRCVYDQDGACRPDERSAHYISYFNVPQQVDEDNEMVADKKEQGFIEHLEVFRGFRVVEVHVTDVDDVEEGRVDEDLDLDSWVVEQGESNGHEDEPPQDEDHAV